jgi:high-affinity K+ transport system ATPase subunit B
LRRKNEGAAMKVLLTVIMTWLSSNFDLPAVHDLPEIKFVTQREMISLRYGGLALNTASELVALYDDKTSTILLSDRWTGNTPAELSVLVHELVHHAQNIAKLTYICPEAREALAYAAQEKWLSLFGQSLLTAFELDPLTLKVRTACM